jgi:leucyl/phenylalanyl-tRNA--protein transferase
MFSRATNASKVALVHLVERLRAGDFTLLDVQFTTDHLTQFGAVGIPRVEYESRLADSLRAHGRWWAIDEGSGAGG